MLEELQAPQLAEARIKALQLLGAGRIREGPDLQLPVRRACGELLAIGGKGQRRDVAILPGGRIRFAPTETPTAFLRGPQQLAGAGVVDPRAAIVAARRDLCPIWGESDAPITSATIRREDQIRLLLRAVPKPDIQGRRSRKTAPIGADRRTRQQLGRIEGGGVIHLLKVSGPEGHFIRGHHGHPAALGLEGRDGDAGEIAWNGGAGRRCGGSRRLADRVARGIQKSDIAAEPFHPGHQGRQNRHGLGTVLVSVIVGRGERCPEPGGEARFRVGLFRAAAERIRFIRLGPYGVGPVRLEGRCHSRQFLGRR